MVLCDAKLLAGSSKVALEFTAVVMPDVLDPTAGQRVEPVEKVPGVVCMFRGIHVGKGKLRMAVNGREDRPF